MILCVAPERERQALELLTQAGEDAWRIGSIAAKDSEQHPSVILRGLKDPASLANG